MKILNKPLDRDFVILNLTDTQLSSTDFIPGVNTVKQIMTGTTKELISRIQPDLITHTGDLSYGEDVSVYEFYAKFMDSFNIPWAFVWGNHDNQAGAEAIRKCGEVFRDHPLCLFEPGDPALGSGNYVIGIAEEEKPVEAIIMMDSHDRAPCGDGDSWAKLTPEQMSWYADIIADLRSRGYAESTIMTHIPIYAYRDAYAAAAKDPERKVGMWESYGTSAWNHGYEDSFGVKFEGICSFEENDGVLEEILRLGHTKNVVVGHDHINNFSIGYKGIRLSYGLKTGCGCYWNEQLNGGTVIKVNSDGVCDMYHEYVDVHDVLKYYEDV